MKTSEPGSAPARILHLIEISTTCERHACRAVGNLSHPLAQFKGTQPARTMAPSTNCIPPVNGGSAFVERMERRQVPKLRIVEVWPEECHR